MCLNLIQRLIFQICKKRNFVRSIQTKNLAYHHHRYALKAPKSGKNRLGRRERVPRNFTAQELEELAVALEMVIIYKRVIKYQSIILTTICEIEPKYLKILTAACNIIFNFELIAILNTNSYSNDQSI